MCTSRSTPASRAARASTGVPSTAIRRWVSRSDPIGCTVVTTALAPATTPAARSGSWKSPTHSSTPGSAGAVPARRTTARTVAPRSTSAAQVREPTRPLAPVTTTTGWVLVGSLMRPTLARRPTRLWCLRALVGTLRGSTPRYVERGRRTRCSPGGCDADVLGPSIRPGPGGRGTVDGGLRPRARGHHGHRAAAGHQPQRRPRHSQAHRARRRLADGGDPRDRLRPGTAARPAHTRLVRRAALHVPDDEERHERRRRPHQRGGLR